MAIIANAHHHSTVSFEQFKTGFAKKYNSEEEHKFRKLIFEENLKKINAINSNSKMTWKAGINHLTDRLPSELKPLLGYNRNVSFFTYNAVAHKPIARDFLQNLPDSVDWREKGVVNAPKDQASCGSCWAFSTASVLESHIAIQTGKLFSISEQQLVSCAPNPDQCGGTGGCEGSTQWLGFKYAQTAGITTEDSWPYTATDGKCDTKKIKQVATIDGYVRLATNDYNALMTAIATVGPIAISVAATEWQFYDSGVYNGDCGAEINHAVVAVGYGTDAKLGDYWLVRNSWSESWGEQGYMRIAREKSAAEVKCEIDYNPSAGSACKGGPDQVEVCGLCGILSDSSYPTGGKLI
jgi:cathepsin L